MKPARIAPVLLKSCLAALAFMAAFAALAAVVILVVRIVIGDELEPIGQMIAAAPDFLAKFASVFLLTWVFTFLNFMKREKTNDT
ncbi:hypothetical protein HNE_0586 [Hyphomonas neptunium ATCC 15444]|uniref:Lipoprotein n=3 Tax=Hyphomonadaceae TaxID=69657 RepID=Q0C4M8_HYPNA|nr:hypothetical protein HNE_0586 [Hyphomonas neptunium ATCC 15444]KCZ96473.1 hypothetical protein HHI_02300 [Hyphomonas hirschiana VP5]